MAAQCDCHRVLCAPLRARASIFRTNQACSKSVSKALHNRVSHPKVHPKQNQVNPRSRFPSACCACSSYLCSKSWHSFTKIDMSHKNHLIILFAILLLTVIGVNACLPKSPMESGSGVNITLYGFSVMKEPLEKVIYPAFAAKWKAEHGVDVHF